MAGVACVSYFTLSGKLYSPSKKNRLCLAQNRPVAVAASGEQTPVIACYPELWGQHSLSGLGIRSLPEFTFEGPQVLQAIIAGETAHQ